MRVSKKERLLILLKHPYMTEYSLDQFERSYQCDSERHTMTFSEFVDLVHEMNVADGGDVDRIYQPTHSVIFVSK